MAKTEIIRSNEVYVSQATWKALGYAAKAREIARDELADLILSQWLKSNCGDVVDYLKQRGDEDKKFRAELLKKQGNSPPF